jgi:outer membrane protein TolC
MKLPLMLHKKAVDTGTKSLLIILFIIPIITYSQDLSLRDAVSYGLEHNEQILRQKEVIIQKEYDYSAMKGNFLPKVSVTGGYTYLSENMQINMDQIKGSLDDVLSKYGVAVANELIPIALSPEIQQGLYDGIYGSLSQLPAYDIEIDNQQFPTANVVATQAIFMGGKIIAGTRFAKAEMNEAKFELVRMSNEVTQTIIKRYLAVSLLQEVVATRKNVLAGIENHRQEAKRAIEIGVVPPHVLLRANVAVANAKRKLADDENNLKLALMALKLEMGMNEDSLIVLKDQLEYKINDIVLDSSIQDAYQNQPVFSILDQKKIMVQQNYNAKRAEMLPKIVAWGEYGFFREELPIIQPPAIVGLQLNMTLFNGFSKANELRSAKHLRTEVELAEKHAENQIKLWVNKSYYELQNSQNKYLEIQSTIAEAETNVDILEKRFAEGMSKSIDVIDAQLLLEGELVSELAILYDYYSALTDFYTATAQPEKLLDLISK